MASILPPAHQEKVDPIHEFFKQEVFDFLEYVPGRSPADRVLQANR